MTTARTPEPPLDAGVDEWLRWALPRHGYDPDERGTPARLAEAADLPPATVSRLLRGKGRPDARTLLAVAKTLGEPVLPLLVRAGFLPPEELSGEFRPRTITKDEALEALGATDAADQNAVLSLLSALHAKGGTT
ncbi:helix-turn-helix transcriptional regulator [Streptomyces sp. ML-6]|uniref:helix-turn-helix domain-containing protein n=1 Tax=Streptomyces sp. ML-6 TaxID=2982693 RepID=UPI0024BFCE54|nr:helix-turn-helix transcriptional regulator [Streptomyces sp. ML-6]MDK0520346.1 helix-turn-helix transcriptional regulator [Streptomyces sp. ML-6]